MGAEEDKRRAIAAREQRHLRPTLTDDPRSSYAYHDDERIAQALPPGTSQPANDGSAPSPPGPQGRFSKSTMVGGHQAPSAALSPHLAEPRGSMAARAPAPKPVKRPALSEPPDIRSWPPLPNVPAGLEAAAPSAPAPAVTHSPQQGRPSASQSDPLAPPSGAIWAAMPSVVDQSPGEGDPFGDQIEPFGDDDGRASRSDPIVLPALGGAPTVVHEAPTPDPKAAYRDPKLALLEPLFERGAWDAVAKELSADPQRSAVVRLLHAIAQREMLASDDKTASSLTQGAITALAELLGVPADSRIALTLAKRLLRRNPPRRPSRMRTGA